MRKLTRKNLDELAKVMPVLSEVQQSNYWGDAKGDADEPYSQDEFWRMLDNNQWTTGGYVSGMGYVAKEAVVTGSYDNTPNNDDSGSNSSWGWPSFGLGIVEQIVFD